MQARRHQLPVLAVCIHLDNQLHTLADTLATAVGYLLEEFQHLGTRQRQETDLILERRHIEHIAIGYIALGEIRTDATHVVDAEHRLFVVVLGCPYEDVGKQVGKVAFRTLGVHVMSHLPDDRTHDTVVDPLIGCDKGRCCLIGMLVIAAVNNDSGTLYAGQLVVFRSTAGDGQKGHTTQEKMLNTHIFRVLRCKDR